MRGKFLPLFAVPSVVLNRKTIFHKIDERVVVEVPGSLIRRLIELCDGTRPLGEVIKLLKDEWDEHSIRGLAKELRRRNVLVDSRYLNGVAWQAVENPSHFPSLITDNEVVLLVEQARQRHKKNPSDNVYQVSPCSLCKLLEYRHSVRSFSGEPIALQSMVNILWSAYGEVTHQENNDEAAHCRRTVPSAGALYPLMIHVVLLRQTEEFSSAVYHVYLGSAGSVGFNLASKDTVRFVRAFVDPLMLEKANGVIVISGSFRITGEKYGNRSMLYVPLEAGHAAQNVHLAAVEQGVATVEVGGFVEKLLAEAINLPKHYHPLTTIVFGRKSEESQIETSNSKLEIQWAMPGNNPYHPPFALVSARVSKKRSWSHGRDASPVLAYTKAIAEAKEWAACGHVPDTLVQARCADLETAVDPKSIIKFHPAQYRLKWFPFKPLDEKTKYAWTEGYDEKTGSPAHILADLVYFPYFPKTPYYAYANSSGVAAHPDRQRAVEASVLELVERDSFMIAYLTQLEFPSVLEQTLPQPIRKRMQELRKFGFRVWIKNHSIDLAPVACIIAQSEEFGCTTCASCASFDIEHAISHALMEVEAFVLARLQKTAVERIKPIEIEMPLDHGKLYDQRQYFHRANFLIRSRKSIAFREVGKGIARSWQELLDRFAAKGWRLFTIPLYLSNEYGGNGDLHIIRSIVPGMVPMTFGYRQEPAGMERIYAVAREWGNKQLSYRELVKFPHPFA